MKTEVTLFPKPLIVTRDGTAYRAIGLCEVILNDDGNLYGAQVLVVNQHGELLTVPASEVEFLELELQP